MPTWWRHRRCAFNASANCQPMDPFSILMLKLSSIDNFELITFFFGVAESDASPTPTQNKKMFDSRVTACFKVQTTRKFCVKLISCGRISYRMATQCKHVHTHTRTGRSEAYVRRRLHSKHVHKELRNNKVSINSMALKLLAIHTRDTARSAPFVWFIVGFCSFIDKICARALPLEPIAFIFATIQSDTRQAVSRQGILLFVYFFYEYFIVSACWFRPRNHTLSLSRRRHRHRISIFLFTVNFLRICSRCSVHTSVSRK